MAAHDQNGQDGRAEQIHLPGPSLIPFVAAAGITLALVGLVLSWWFVWTGVAIVVITVVRWISIVRQEIASLPTQHRG